MTEAEPDITIKSREDLLYLLAEAAEIEHNLMCCYLFAAFSIKTEADGLSHEDATELARWKRAIIGVAVEEMTHLALVANLTSAVGGAPHFGRPNFPVAPGYHPSGVIVELRKFDRATLDHFIYLERPEGVEFEDADLGPRIKSTYRRGCISRRFMPSAQDYGTVGHLYRGIERGLNDLVARLGEDVLFHGDPALQVGAELVNLPGLAKVTDLASALHALDTIVEQGEGSSADSEQSHYRRFLAIRESYNKRLELEPDFKASRAVAPNPVMRPPPDPAGKTYIDNPDAAHVMELANAIYGGMLRALAQGFADTNQKRKQRFLDAAVDSMFALGPVAEHLTTLPATSSQPGLVAGMSFAMLRDVAALPISAPAEKVFAERLRELADGAGSVLSLPALSEQVCGTLRQIAEKLDPRATQTASTIETVEGTDVIISFEAKRCIHARFCVLQQPEVFKANVDGEWIAPDDATSTEGLIATVQNCPSGAITYVRKDRGPEEAAPPVNLVQVRENGPLSLRADFSVDGVAGGLRATLCRCGQSKNKPYCDNSHIAASFRASGEPDTGDVTPLASRGGPIDIRPQKNGPLLVSGNVELISGTGRTFRKTTNAMLCRCGASANKPYCDGSHARVGFQS
jgi:CDGSH-type Zn-finger protein/uncharacterized Fe-S cluster protein YjdI